MSSKKSNQINVIFLFIIEFINNFVSQIIQKWISIFGDKRLLWYFLSYAHNTPSQIKKNIKFQQLILIFSGLMMEHLYFLMFLSF